MDTWHPMTYVLSTKCDDSCPNKVYNPGSLKGTSASYSIGASQMTGYYYTDQVCLPSSNLCAADYKFFAAESITNVSNVPQDGSIGLGPKTSE